MLVLFLMKDFSYREGKGQEKTICPEDRALKSALFLLPKPQDLRERLYFLNCFFFLSLHILNLKNILG